MKFIYGYIFLFFFCGILPAQQDPQYSQYMFNQVILNPASIGSRNAINVMASFRKEWVNVNGTPQTNNLSVSGPLKDKKIGLGGHLTQENIGPRKWTTAYMDYCYRVKLGKGKLSFGLSTGIMAYNFNSTKLDLYDKEEPVLYMNSVNRSVKFDLNAGAYYFTRSYYVGFSATHLTSPKMYREELQPGVSNKFYNLNQHFFLTAGRAFLIRENLVFSPSIMVQSVFLKEATVDVNANFLIYSKVWIGLSCRSSMALVGLAQYIITDRLKIGYSYDYGFRGIARSSYGSHEIMLSYDFLNTRSKIVNSRFL